MSELNNNTLQYKKEIKKGFELLEPSSNGIIEISKLNDFTNAINSKNKNPFLYYFINSLTEKKDDENEDSLSYKEYMSFLDDQLNDTKSREGLKTLFSIFADDNKNNISWTKFALVEKELGDIETSNKLLKLLEQAKLYGEDLSFKEFSDIVTEEYLNEINNQIEDYSNKQTYKQKKKRNKKKEEEDNDELGTISSKNSYKERNEENKKSGDDNDVEKSNKRYHRRYRDNKNKSDNNENGNSSNKAHSKYRKKH